MKLRKAVYYISTQTTGIIFDKIAFFDGGSSIAIPDTENIPQSTKFYKPVKFYRHSSDAYDGNVEIIGKCYALANNVNKIAPDYSDLIISEAVCDTILFSVYMSAAL